MDTGRAMPPRPSLMTGDDAACDAAWARLQPRAADLLAALPLHRSTSQLELLEAALAVLRPVGRQQQQQGRANGMTNGTQSTPQQQLPVPLQLLQRHVCAGRLPDELTAHRDVVDKLGPLVVGLRALRESLVANLRTHTHMARQVYELACDVAAAAGQGAASELLKALHGLVSDIYPQLEAMAGQAAGAGAGAGCERAGEVHAAHLLFFSVAPNKPPPAERVAVLRKLVGGYLDHPAVKWAVKAVSALARTDWSEVWAVRECPPSRLLMEVLDMQLGKLRLQALAACAMSYRSLPWGAAMALFGLQEQAAERIGNDGSGPSLQGLTLHTSPGSGPGPLWPVQGDAWEDEGSGASGGAVPGQPVQTAQAVPDAAGPLLALCGLLHEGSVRGIRGSVVAWDTLQAKVVAGAGMPELGDVVFKV